MVILPNLFSALLNWPMSSGWIKANVGQIGYYRVNYEKENWRALYDQLSLDHRVSINLRPQGKYKLVSLENRKCKSTP